MTKRKGDPPGKGIHSAKQTYSQIAKHFSGNKPGAVSSYKGVAPASNYTRNIAKGRKAVSPVPSTLPTLDFGLTSALPPLADLGYSRAPLALPQYSDARDLGVTAPTTLTTPWRLHASIIAGLTPGLAMNFAPA